MQRRFFVGDLHGCVDELEDLLSSFGFVPGSDQLFSVGDILGKGPNSLGVLIRLKQLHATIVLGNHDAHGLKAASLPQGERKANHQLYLDSLGPAREAWLTEIATWPLFYEEKDFLLVHAGLEPGVSHPSTMHREILLNIRTWDGVGQNLKIESNPPWFECVTPQKIVIFGHWAKRGLVDLPHFKGLDTGCVYGRQLTGWCLEENRFYQVPARRVYAEIKLPP